MRVFGAARVFDGAGGGGGPPIIIASSDSSVIVAEAPAGTFDLTATSASIPSTGPSDVQADLDLLAGSVATSVKKIENWADFTLYATEAPAGTWTFDQVLLGSGSMVVPVGAKIIGGENASLVASAPAGFTVFADVDAAAFTGPLIMDNLEIIQGNAGAAAVGVDIVSTGARAPFVTSTQIIGGRVGLRWTTVVGVAKVVNTISINADVGFEVKGTVNTVIASGTFTQSVVPGHVGFVVDSSSTITGGVQTSEPSFSLVDGQFGFAIAHGATFTPPSIMQISGAANSGPQNALIRQTAPGVTDMAADDDRLVVKGGPSVVNWTAEGVASRFDAGDPLIVDNSAVGAGVNVIIPYEDAVGNLEIVASLESHFTFFKDAVEPLDWYFEYTGPLSDATIRIAADILARRANIGPSTSILCWERAPFIGPGHGAFDIIPDSAVPWENTNRLKARAGVATFKGVNTFDRFRPLVSDSTATDVDLAEIKIDLSISS